MKTIKTHLIVMAFLFSMQSYATNCLINAGLKHVDYTGMDNFIDAKDDLTGAAVETQKSTKTANFKQRIKADPDASVVATRIDVTGPNFSDKMWFFVEPTCTCGFDTGWDGMKIFGDPAVTQIYGIEDNNAYYQINAKSDIHNSLIGFKPGNDRNFTMKFTHQGISNEYTNLYLVDMVANQTVNVFTSGTLYNFTSSANDPVQRFKIITNTGVTTGNTFVEFENNTDVFKMNNRIVVNNRNQVEISMKLFDATGHCIVNKNIKSNTQIQIDKSITKGIYIIQLKLNNQNYTKKVVVN